MPPFNFLPGQDMSALGKKQELSSKAVAEAQRHIEVLKDRGHELQDILSHDLFASSPLFEGYLPA